MNALNYLPERYRLLNIAINCFTAGYRNYSFIDEEDKDNLITNGFEALRGAELLENQNNDSLFSSLLEILRDWIEYKKKEVLQNEESTNRN